MTGESSVDPIDLAIERTDPKPTETRVQIGITLPTGRGAALDLPQDVTVPEVMHLITFIAGGELAASLIKVGQSVDPPASKPRLAIVRRALSRPT